ncbi:MAG: hypothetical protein HN705_16440 [Rhodospirillales bacterium]|jgi:uncharacterized protein|nr:hypothetical protein [Rhodospirillales bacterium]
MDDSAIPYDTWIDEALRSVVRRVLMQAAAEGLPGEHHFYVTFRTPMNGVEIPGFLRAEHPDTMTIVLQHQYQNLEVGRDFFSVSLRFNGRAEALRIPFEAITSFADPSVNFGLQLKAAEAPMDEYDANEHIQSFKPETVVPGENTEAATSPAEKDGGSDDEQKTGEVITLDAFRKK